MSAKYLDYLVAGFTVVVLVVNGLLGATAIAAGDPPYIAVFSLVAIAAMGGFVGCYLAIRKEERR